MEQNNFLNKFILKFQESFSRHAFVGLPKDQNLQHTVLAAEPAHLSTPLLYVQSTDWKGALCVTEGTVRTTGDYVTCIILYPWALLRDSSLGQL